MFKRRFANKIGIRTAIVMLALCLLNMKLTIADTPSEKTAPPEKQLPIPGEVFTVEGHTAFLILPPKVGAENKGDARAKKAEAIPWVWYAPTLPGLPDGSEKWMWQKFLDAGIAIAGVDIGESFGNPEGRRLYSVFHDELVAKRGLSKRACLMARSRGGLMLYNWAVEHPESVACIAGIYPVMDIRSYPTIGGANVAYGMTTQELMDHLSEHNPIDRIEPLAKERVPIFHIHGDSDTVVPLEANSGELAKRYKQFGGEMTLEIAKGQGHNMWEGFFQSQNLVDFVLAHARDPLPAVAKDARH